VVAALWLIGGVDRRLRLGGRVHHDEIGRGTVASIATSGKIVVQFDAVRTVKMCRMQDLRPVSRISSSFQHSLNTQQPSVLAPRSEVPSTIYYAPAAIRPSVCLSHGAAAWAIGTPTACSLATTSHQRCVDCGPVRGRT